ncbi:MAG: IS200/IS605 family accessory protein TnpB-related protein [Defluviitaleaceae bacterium]|nr:IS200/IS605 family accessory protein TnpB-related protein [Defluviitaleaceae bacterium]
MKLQCSAMRTAYNHKTLPVKDLRDLITHKYPELLDGLRRDAILKAEMLNQDNACFGSKHLFKTRSTNLISKQEFNLRRNNQLYCRGDKSRQGNRNIRFKQDNTIITLNLAKKTSFTGKAYFPPKFRNFDKTCYDARLIYDLDKDQFRIILSYKTETILPIYKTETILTIITSPQNGVLGVDMNPDCVAVAELDYNGNIKKHLNLNAQRLPFARADKRQSDINLLAKLIVDLALETVKPIVIESLFFDTKRTKARPLYKKFNRMRHNFTYRKLSNAVLSRAYKNQVKVFEVNPAYTSLLGIINYQEKYSLNRHTASAVAIGRRGMGFKERLTASTTPITKLPKSYFNKRKNKPVPTTGIIIASSTQEHFLTEKSYNWIKTFIK